MSFGPLEPFDLSWRMLDFVRLWNDTGGIAIILCGGSICGRCSFHYQLSWSFSGKGQTARPQIGTWGVWFLACALQNEIFLSHSFIIIKAESSETKQNHDTAAEKMSDKCSYALVSKLLDFIWLSLMTLTFSLTNCIKEYIPFVRINTIVLPSKISLLYSHELCLKCSDDLNPNLVFIFWINLRRFPDGNKMFLFSDTWDILGWLFVWFLHSALPLYQLSCDWKLKWLKWRKKKSEKGKFQSVLHTKLLYRLRSQIVLFVRKRHKDYFWAPTKSRKSRLNFPSTTHT